MGEEWTGGRSGPLKFDPFPSTESLNIYKEKTFFLSSLKKILFPHSSFHLFSHSIEEWVSVKTHTSPPFAFIYLNTSNRFFFELARPLQFWEEKENRIDNKRVMNYKKRMN